MWTLPLEDHEEFRAEVSAAGFAAHQRIAAEQFTEFKEVSDTASVFERLVQVLT